MEPLYIYKKHIGDELSDFLLNILMTITPYASLVLSILVTIVSVIVYNSSRKKLKLWNQSDEQDEIIDNIEVKLSYVLLFASVNLIIGFFFFELEWDYYLKTHMQKVISFFHCS